MPGNPSAPSPWIRLSRAGGSALTSKGRAGHTGQPLSPRPLLPEATSLGGAGGAVKPAGEASGPPPSRPPVSAGRGCWCAEGTRHRCARVQRAVSVCPRDLRSLWWPAGRGHLLHCTPSAGSRPSHLPAPRRPAGFRRPTRVVPAGPHGCPWREQCCHAPAEGGCLGVPTAAGKPRSPRAETLGGRGLCPSPTMN